MIVPFTAIVADTGICGSAEFFDHTGSLALDSYLPDIACARACPPFIGAMLQAPLGYILS